MKNGRKGLNTLTTNDGKISANKIAPVDMILHTLSVLGDVFDASLCDCE